MQKITFSIILSLFYLSVSAHNELKIENLTSENPHILYIGLNNHLKIPNSKITIIKIGDKEFSSSDLSSDEFFLSVVKVGVTKVDFYQGTTLIETKEYQAKRVSDPVLSLSGVKPGTKITVEQILKNPKLEIQMESKLKNLGFEVVSYDIILSPKDGDMVVSTTNGPEIKSQMISHIANFKPGSIIMFEKVKVKGPDGSVRLIPGLIHQII